MKQIGYIIVDRRKRQWFMGALLGSADGNARCRELGEKYPKSAPFRIVPVYADL